MCCFWHGHKSQVITIVMNKRENDKIYCSQEPNRNDTEISNCTEKNICEVWFLNQLEAFAQQKSTLENRHAAESTKFSSKNTLSSFKNFLKLRTARK